MNSKEVSERASSAAAVALPRKLTANGSAASAAVTQHPPAPAHVFPPHHHHSAVTTTTLYPHVVDVVPTPREHRDGDISDLQHHHHPHQSSRQQPLSSSNDVFYASDMPLPPPPPQYNDSRPLCELEVDLCRKLSCGGQCHSQDSLNNSGYSDVEEEDEELEDVLDVAEAEEEDGYYHIMPRKNHHQHNQHGLAVAAAARGHHVGQLLNPECNNSQIESHSCQTNYEDHATQTEDESEADSGAEDQEDLKDEAAVLFPPYGKSPVLPHCATVDPERDFHYRRQGGPIYI